MQKQRHGSVGSNCAADQRLCFCSTDSTIPLLSKSEILSLQQSPVAVQPGLCWSRSETPKTGFLTARLICKHLYTKVALDIDLTYSKTKKGENLGLVLKQ